MRDHGERMTIDGGRTNEQRPPSFSWKVHAIAVWFVRTFYRCQTTKAGRQAARVHENCARSAEEKEKRREKRKEKREEEKKRILKKDEIPFKK